jgi:hypothetical protein
VTPLSNYSEQRHLDYSFASTKSDELVKKKNYCQLCAQNYVQQIPVVEHVVHTDKESVITTTYNLILLRSF